MEYRCNNWTCLNDEVYKTEGKCSSCNMKLSEKQIMNDLNRVFALAKLYVESQDTFTSEQTTYACTQIENLHTEIRKTYTIQSALEIDEGI